MADRPDADPAPRKRKPTLKGRRRVTAEAPTPGKTRPQSGAAIRRRGDGEPAPLSYPQERLWFLEQLMPGSAAFNVPVAAPLRGRLDVDLLARCFREVADRHEILRTHFEDQNGQTVQVTSPLNEFELEVIDLRGHPAPDREAEALRIANDEARRPFDLAHGPLWRASLLALDDEEHWLLWIVHHVVTEGTGIATCFAELSALYGAYTAGQPSPLAELPLQYGDFAVWQRQQAADASPEHLEYWKKQLAGPLPTLQLPTDRPRPITQTHDHGAWYWRQIDADLTNGVKALAQTERATLYIVLLSAFKAFLGRYTRQHDITVGAAVSQRDRPELLDLIGFFVNTIVLRTDLGGDPTFRDLIQRVREVALDGYSHAGLPFEMVVEALQPGRDAARNPMFQVMFELPTDPMPVIELPGLQPARIKGPLEVNTGTTKSDLDLYMWEESGGMVAAIEYNAELFDGPTIERMLANLETLLRGSVANPDARVSELPLLSAEERTTVLETWNATAADHPRTQCIHELVEAQAAAAPDATALALGDEKLTYADWNGRANRLAHHLRGLGVGPDVLVGVLMERTPQMVTALLAVMKAGGAYVPLDPVNPKDRQASMIEDAGMSVLLTQESLLSEIPDTDVDVLCVDRDAAAFAHQSADNPDLNTEVENLAYVIFTSGSTGRPKGVQISHRALLNLVFWHRDVYEITPADRAALVAGLAFDASVWELWPYLTAGAGVWLPDEETRAVPARLYAWLAEKAITVCFVPTPLCEAMLKEDCPPGMAMRAILTGGDKLHHAPSEGLPFTLINHYGPTESTVVTTCTPVPAGAGPDHQPPIGRPIANIQVYLLDEHRNPVPIGVPGELYVGGESLAHGYHGRPDLTEEKFVPHPFRQGERLYATGDLARYLQDGQIEFLGRIDHQVKVRGFRIELGEIEVVLAQHSAVRENVVVALRDGDGAARLVAYVVPESGQSPTAAELRGHLKEKLPDYMVPAAYVCMDSFPLTANGKIDRRALPEPDDQRPDLDASYAAPEDETQTKIAQLWTELLNLERVGIHDNFFDLGGHSLLIVQLHRRLKAELDSAISIAQMFQYPTIAAMAGHLSGKGDDKEEPTSRGTRRKSTSRQRERRKRV